MDVQRTDDPGPADASASAGLTVAVSGSLHVLHRGDGAVTIGREPPSHILLPEPGISRTHVRLEYQDEQWMLTDVGSRNGTFLDGARVEHLVVDRTVIVHLGHPNGVALHLDPHPDHAPPPEQVDDTTARDEPPDGALLARVGVAVTERREELGLSAQTLAREVMTPQDYASFEGGGLWPEPDSRAVLEQRLLWPAGVLADIYRGAAVPDDEFTDLLSPTVQVAVAIDAAAIEVRNIGARIHQLPDPGDRRFARDVTALLTQLRLLDHLVSAASRRAPGRLDVAAAVVAVRQARGDLLDMATASPRVTVGQRLGAMRYRAHFTVAEVATAAGVSSADVEAVEREDRLPAPITAAIHAFLAAIEDHHP